MDGDICRIGQRLAQPVHKADACIKYEKKSLKKQNLVLTLIWMKKYANRF